MTTQDIDAITPAAGWDDGRKGFNYCRFDAVIDPERLLRAELTWDDDGTDNPSQYTAPQLTIESNTPDPKDPTRWVTKHQRTVTLTDQEAKEIAEQPPTNILARYPEEVRAVTRE